MLVDITIPMNLISKMGECNPWTFFYILRLYHEKFAASQNGACGITLNIHWAEPKDPRNSEDLDAAETYLQFNFGWFAHPILKDGKYPSIMREKIDDKSEKQGK